MLLPEHSLNVPVGTLERFYRNTVDNSEISENHLKAIGGWRQVIGAVEFSAGADMSAGKSWGEGKAAKVGERGWQSRLGSANYMDLRIWGPPAKMAQFDRPNLPDVAGDSCKVSLVWESELSREGWSVSRYRVLPAPNVSVLWRHAEEGLDPPSVLRQP